MGWGKREEEEEKGPKGPGRNPGIERGWNS